MKKRLSLTEAQINQSAVSDVRAAVYETVSKLASGNVAAVKLAQLVVEARGIEPLSESSFMQLSTSVFYLL